MCLCGRVYAVNKLFLSNRRIYYCLLDLTKAFVSDRCVGSICQGLLYVFTMLTLLSLFWIEKLGLLMIKLRIKKDSPNCFQTSIIIFPFSLLNRRKKMLIYIHKHTYIYMRVCVCVLIWYSVFQDKCFNSRTDKVKD